MALAVIGLMAAPASGQTNFNAIPVPDMPAVNAFDTYNTAVTLEVNTDLVDAALGTNSTSPTPEAPLSQIDLLISENQPVIQKIHLGLTQPYVNPPIRSAATLLPYLAKQRSLARLLSLQTYDDALHGNYSASMTSTLEAIEYGSDIERGGPMLSMLVGLACEAIGRRAVYRDNLVDNLNAPDSRQDAMRLVSIDKNETTYSENMQQEAWTEEASIKEISGSSNWQSVVAQSGNDGSDASKAAWQRQAAAMNPAVSYGLVCDYLSIVVDHAKLSWPNQQGTPLPPIPNDPICKILFPMFSLSSLRKYVNTAYIRLLETQLALHAYDLDYHQYPASLSQLTPTFLPAVPIDPFSNNESLKYQLNGAGYLLYSIGPDATDDAGKPIVDSTTNTDATAIQSKFPIIGPQSKGDIVAGVDN